MADTGSGTTVIVNIPDYTPFFQQLVTLAVNATTATIIPAGTFSTTGTFGLLTVSNTVSTIGPILVGMVLDATDIQPGTVVLARAAPGASWTSWYLNKPQELDSRPVTGLSPLVSMAANANAVAADVHVLSESGIKTNSFSWYDLVKTYSWYIQENHTVNPENISSSTFQNFVTSITSVTNNLPRFL